MNKQKLEIFYVFLKNCSNPGLFFIYFCLFKHITNVITNMYVKKCPSSILCRDSNLRPLEYESPWPLDQGSLPKS